MEVKAPEEEEKKMDGGTEGVVGRGVVVLRQGEVRREGATPPGSPAQRYPLSGPGGEGRQGGTAGGAAAGPMGRAGAEGSRRRGKNAKGRDEAELRRRAAGNTEVISATANPSDNKLDATLLNNGDSNPSDPTDGFHQKQTHARHRSPLIQ
ncbi:hypothetical protein E2C01_008415 [Portunus trituberculatus]|uniref:Uncharacterized protein n=1 Tax=Portunus trituberculatus TaxID=210409 RepID=A0A5B7D0S3_PORTR|nr:hypothetical protein [Portunus trituberculatus]